VLNTRLHNRGNGLLAVHASTENDIERTRWFVAKTVIFELRGCGDEDA
jgi:hypothetical protein